MVTDTAADRARCRDLTTSDVLVWTGSGRVSRDTVKIIDRRKDSDDGWWMTDGSGLADSVWDNGTAWVTLPDLLRMAEDGIAAREALARVSELAEKWTLPQRKPFEPLPDERAAGLNAAARGIRRAITGEA